MEKITRVIQSDIEKKLFGGKVLIIYGARQVGKTTLIRKIEEKYPEKSIYLNCDEPDVRMALTDKTSTELKEFIGNKELVLIDEAQRVENIGLTLKLLVDNFPNLQILATGSSSFELANRVVEPLTGRKYEYQLYPFSMTELSQKYSEIEQKRLLEERMIFGFYPQVVLGGNREEDLKSITSSYLFRDIFSFDKIKNPKVLERLLQALALQIGSEVSYNELAQLLGIDKKTVASYVQILEKSFIIFRRKSFARNLRNELKKFRKVYFYDLGIRNALINNLNPLTLRDDIGALWENFVVVERLKKLDNQKISSNNYYWRTTTQKEIDLVEEREGKLFGYEFKWNNRKKVKAPKDWLETYDNASWEVITPENYRDFIR